MKIDGFLKIGDIPGASIRDGHDGEIEIHGMEFAMAGPHDPNTLSRSGRVVLGMIKFQKNYDQASPFLKQAIFQNKMLGEVLFSARRTIDGATSDYLVIKMTDASVVEYKVNVSLTEANLLEELVAFAYKEITFTYDGSFETVMDVHIGV